MSRNPAAGGVCGRESAPCTTGGSMIVLTDNRLVLVVRVLLRHAEPPLRDARRPHAARRRDARRVRREARHRADDPQPRVYIILSSLAVGLCGAVPSLPRVAPFLSSPLRKYVLAPTSTALNSFRPHRKTAQYAIATFHEVKLQSLTVMQPQYSRCKDTQRNVSAFANWRMQAIDCKAGTFA